jgi:sugar lactone lactonase YvrE
LIFFYILAFEYCGDVEIISGSKKGFRDGKDAMFNSPTGICIDLEGNIIISDNNNHKIRKITNGIVSTIAGGDKGYRDGKNAQFHYPNGICIDHEGNIIVADTGNNKIRKITKNGIVSTIFGHKIEHNLKSPYGICIDCYGDIIVTDTLEYEIRIIEKIGHVTTIKLDFPFGICVNDKYNIIITDAYNHTIRKIVLYRENRYSNSIISGESQGFFDGHITNSLFDQPFGVCLDHDGNIIIADTYNNKIRKIKNDFVSTIAGSKKGIHDGIIFNKPTGVCVDYQGNILVTSTENHQIIKIKLCK